MRQRDTLTGSCLALPLLLSLLAGCSAGSGESSGGAITDPTVRLDKTSALEDQFKALGYRLAWRGLPTIRQGGSIESFEILGDICAVQDTETGVSILEAGTGKKRWSTSLANPLTRFVGMIRDDNHLIVSSESEVYFLDVQTGNLLSRQHLERVVNTRPLQAGQILIFGTTTGEVLGHLTLNGFKTWGNSVRGSVDAPPVRIGSAYAVVSAGGEVLVGDMASGSGMFRARIFDGPAADLAANDFALYIPSRDHSLYAFSTTSGGVLWRLRSEAPITSPPTCFGDAVYCTIPGLGLSALDAQNHGPTGGPIFKWSNANADGVVVGISNGRLLAWNGKIARTIDPATGQTIEERELPGVTFFKPDSFENGNLYTATESGVVQKYLPR